LGNTKQGIQIYDSHNTIGSCACDGRNIISGNERNGILIASAAKNTRVVGNYIGTDRTGKHPLGNGENGIQLGAAGGMNEALKTLVEHNLISSNQLFGIKIQSHSHDNTIKHNVIGKGA